MTINTDGAILAAAGDANGNLNVSWEECTTLDDLISRINDTGSYVATLIDVRPNVKTHDLDTTAAVSVMAVATFNSNLAAFAETLAGMQYIGEVKAVSTTLFVVPDNTEAFMYFSGATAGSYNVGDWADSFAVLEE